MLRISLREVCITLFLLSSCAQPNADTIAPKLLIDNSDGGSLTTRKITKLNKYLSENNCPIVLSDPTTTNSESEPDLVFDPLVRTDEIWIPFLSAESAGGQWVQPAILVRGSASNDLSGLSNVHFAFVSNKSNSGFLGQIKLLSRAGVNPNTDKDIYANNHIGAMSLLMHKDVFAAGVDRFLAENWLQANNLKIIAKGDKSEVGGIYLNQASLLNKPENADLMKSCREAFLQLNRESRENRKIMGLFPDWLVRFAHDNRR